MTTVSVCRTLQNVKPCQLNKLTPFPAGAFDSSTCCANMAAFNRRVLDNNDVVMSLTQWRITGDHGPPNHGQFLFHT